MTQQEPLQERAEVEPQQQVGKRGDDGVAIKPISMGKAAELEFNAFMLLLSCIKDIDIQAGDFVKGVATMTHRGYIALVFQRMRSLITQWNYKVQNATTYMAMGLPNSEFKQFLEKLAQALSAGVRLREFNRVQSTRYMIQFDANYTRIIDRLKQISEMFAALVSSMSFMAVSMLIVTMTVGLGSPTVDLLTTGLGVIAIVFVMVFLIRTFTPKERVLVKTAYMPFNLHRFHLISRPMVIICAAIGVGLPAILLLDPYFSSNLDLGVGLPMAVAGVPLLLMGRAAKKRVAQVTKSEEQYSAFIKNFGEAYAVTGSTKDAIQILTHGDYGALEDRIYSMLARLESGMSSDTAWKFFAEECGSYLVQYHTEALRDALYLGASAAPASEAIFSSFNAAHTRRQRREQVAGFLKAMITPLQLCFAAVLVFVQAIVNIFSLIATQVAQYILILRPVDPHLVAYYTLGVIAACLVGSSVGISIVEGQSEFDLPYNLGFQLLSTGILVAIVAFAAALMLNQFANINLGTSLG